MKIISFPFGFYSDYVKLSDKLFIKNKKSQIQPEAVRFENKQVL